MNAERCYLEPMINGSHRVFLPDGEELKLCSSSLHDPSITDLCPSPSQLWIVACYKERSISVKVEGVPLIYIDRKPTITADILKIFEGSVIEIQPSVIIYLLEFSNIRKESINLSAAGTRDLLRLKSRIYRWEMFTGGQLFTCTSEGFDEKREKVASFDLDGTLIKWKSDDCPNDIDWNLWHDCIKSELCTLQNNGYKIIIFTNQAGILRPNSSLKLHLFKSKIENIINRLGIPVQIYMATFLGGPYRKPVPGMWKLMEHNSKIKANLEKSFYVGDAAGREHDFAAIDRIFAENIGLNFYTPEEFFLKELPSPFVELKYRPTDPDRNAKMPDLKVPSDQQEVIIMVGPRSSGKTFFVEEYLIPKGYVPVSLDYFDDWNLGVPVLVDILDKMKCAVVDHTNWKVSHRWKYVYLCRLRDVKVRCFIMEWSINRCAHNNKFKRIFDPNYAAVSPKVLEKYGEVYEKPTMDEGYADILSIPFIPKFICKEMKFLYNCYLHSQ